MLNLIDVPLTIDCVECGGEAHRIPREPEDGFEPGDVVPFVCVECGYRHDVVQGEDADGC